MYMNDEEIRQLMMKVVDGVASPEEEKAMSEAVENNEILKSELRAFNKIKEVTENMQFKELPDSYWTGYWDDIYRRTERAFAWILMSVGLIVIIGFSAYKALSWLYSDPDISILLKAGVSMALLGVIIMIVSILRERMFARKREKYEKEVER